MFTGLVECMGTIKEVTGRSPRRLCVDSSIPASEVGIGESIAIDGCCLTVVERGGRGLWFEAATETLKRTTLGALGPGDRVNLERALRLGDRLGGHLVLGHVDGIGKVEGREQIDSALYVHIAAPEEISRLIAARGSVTVAGVSLTVTEVRGHAFSVGLIPHTLAVTNLGTLETGNGVNLEADVIARHVERLMEGGDGQGRGAGTLLS